MRVSVHFLSYLSSLVGAEQVELNLPEPACLGDLSRLVQEMYPEHTAILSRVAYMIDQKHAALETPLRDGMQVLVLMQLSGG